MSTFLIKTKEIFSRKNALRVQRILIIIIILLIALDFYWADKGIATISSVIRDHAYDWGIWMPWVWGVLAGHLFFDRKYNIPIKEIHAILIIVVITIALAIFSYCFEISGNNIKLQIFLLLIGFLAGFYMWPQKTKEEKEKILSQKLFIK